MCLITEQKKPIKIHKDMTVYKIVCIHGKSIESFSREFSWTLNKLEQTEMKKSIDVSYMGSSVLNKYLSGWYADNLTIYCKRKQYTCIGEGFHSCKDEATANEFMWLDRSLARCTIPAGSLIYKDKTGLIVSNQIIMNEIL